MILRGQQPVELTANRLAHNTNMPAAWEEQRGHHI